MTALQPGGTDLGSTVAVPQPRDSGAAPQDERWCVIVPTRNEAENIAPLVARIGSALADRSAEVLFVDDSDDETPEAIRAVAESAPLGVRVLHRSPDERVGALGGAVVAGARSTDADWVVVIDGDLQHPPEDIPRLIAAVERESADIAVASRYVSGGDADGLGSGFRAAVSSGAGTAARLIFPRRLAAVTDPMSGFFAVKRPLLVAPGLRPRGFKILLETLVRSDRPRVVEVPFRFAGRESGASKAGFREAVRFLWLLLSLRATVDAGAVSRLVRFGLVGISGMGVNIGVLTALTASGLLDGLGAVSESVAATVATQVAILWNFALTEGVVFPRRPRAGRWLRFAVFWGLGMAALSIQLPLTLALVASTGLGYVPAAGVAIALLAAVRFGLLDRLVYRRLERRTSPERAPG